LFSHSAVTLQPPYQCCAWLSFWQEDSAPTVEIFADSLHMIPTKNLGVVKEC